MSEPKAPNPSYALPPSHVHPSSDSEYQSSTRFSTSDPRALAHHSDLWNSIPPHNAPDPGPAQEKTKLFRTAQACNYCRERKRKCDGRRPCDVCVRDDQKCEYRAAPPPLNREKVMNDMRNRVAGIVNEVRSELNTWRKDVERRLTKFEGTAVPTSLLASPDVPLQNSQITSTGSTSLQRQAGLQSAAAYSLLEDWHGMKEWCSGIIEDKHNLSDYPMQLEQNRGIIQDLEDPAGNDESDVGSDVQPDFGTAVVDALLESYFSNIHNLHPFLDCCDVRGMFRRFKDQYSGVARGLKRKRTQSVGYSLHNAVVLLILALGKACSYNNQLPLDFPGISLHPEGPFNDTANRTRRGTIESIPGMAYYSLATKILGHHVAGNTIVHAQAFILAALYVSQFARVLESWNWIGTACRVIIILFKADIKKFDRQRDLSGLPIPKERDGLNPVLFAFWTCLQLESEVVVDMKTLSTSGLAVYQSIASYPQAWSDDLFEQILYSSQIHLTVTMNEVHEKLYRSTTSRDRKALIAVTEHYVERLQDWRNMLHPDLAWDDDDFPSTNFDIARMRAKYYDCLCIVHRPYLLVITSSDSSISHQVSLGRSGTASTGGNERKGNLYSDYGKIIHFTSKCIHATIQSTIAFDRVGAPDASPYARYQSTRKRSLVLSNIFGTLHAQFGNMLVLAAVFTSTIYQDLPRNTPLTPSNMDALFERTISVLEETAPNSPILQLDLRILQNTRMTCWACEYL